MPRLKRDKNGKLILEGPVLSEEEERELEKIYREEMEEFEKEKELKRCQIGNLVGDEEEYEEEYEDEDLPFIKNDAGEYICMENGYSSEDEEFSHQEHLKRKGKLNEEDEREL